MKENELMQWESEYSVGVGEIDSQHRELMNHVNHLISHSVEYSQTGIRSENKKHFVKLAVLTKDYAIKHFKTEEKLLSKTGYDKFDDHRNEHERLTVKMLTITDELKKNKGEMDLFNLTVNFKEWLLSHILLYDIGAKEFFKTGVS